MDIIQGGDITEMENSYSGYLLPFITDYYEYYGTFLKVFIDFWTKTQQSPQNPHI